MRIRRACLVLLWLSAASASAQPAPAAAPAATPAPDAYAPGTGDAWVDRQLQDMELYAARYPDSFLDELARYGQVPRGYAEALLRERGWRPGDIYFACFMAKAAAVSCRTLVRARAGAGDADWEQTLAPLQIEPGSLHYRALRHAIVASYDHWDRPIALDALLRRQLGDRAQRDKAAAARP